MALTALPAELLLTISEELASEADRQSLRLVNHRLYCVLPPATIFDSTKLKPLYFTLRVSPAGKWIGRREVEVKEWSCKKDQMDFLRRLFNDLTVTDQEEKIICFRCRRLSAFEYLDSHKTEGSNSGDKGLVGREPADAKVRCFRCGDRKKHTGSRRG